MKVEALYMRQGYVEVNYIFENITDKDITAEVFFPLPKRDFVEGYFNDYFYNHAFNFKLWVNGAETPYKSSMSIFQYLQGKYDSRDITHYVKSYLADIIKDGDAIITEKKLSEILSSLTHAQREELVTGEVITLDYYIDAAMEESQNKVWQSLGMWTKTTNYYWTQTFPALSTVWIKHTYSPSSFMYSSGPAITKCTDLSETPQYEEFIVKVNGQNSDKNPENLHANGYYEYVLVTGNNWEGPIENFNLLVETSAAGVLCMDNNPLFINGRFYAKNTATYIPSHDLSIGFVDYGPQESAAKPVLYKIDGPANVRAKPVNGDIIGVMQNGSYAWVFEDTQNKGWYRVIQNGTEGYTYKNNIIAVFLLRP